MNQQDPNISVFPTQPYQFDDLRLMAGHRLQLEVPGRDEPVPARLLGFMKGESLIVKLPIAHLTGVHALREGDALEVRGFSGRIAFTFKSAIQQIRYSPYAYCHLLFPEAIHGTEIRHAERVRVNLPVKVAGAAVDGETVVATISNISINGALLISAAPLGDIGEHITLTFRFWILPNEYEVNMNVAAVIQASATHESAESSGETQYGVKFEGMRSTESILLQNLIYQRLKEDPDTTV